MQVANTITKGWVALILVPALASVGASQEEEWVAPAPDRGDQGDGPFERLTIRGATVIDGTGAPPAGPVDIVIVATL